MREQNVKIYQKQICDYKALTKEEEKHLFNEYVKTGNLSYRDKIIESNLKYVVKVAYAYANRGVTVDELIAEGNMGLIHAFTKYNPNKYDNKFFSFASFWIEFKMAERIKKDVTNYNNFFDTNCDVGMISRVDESTNDGLNINNELITSLMGNLDERETVIINHSYGLGNHEILSLKEMSVITNLSPSRIRTIRDNAMAKMRGACLSEDISL